MKKGYVTTNPKKENKQTNKPYRQKQQQQKTILEETIGLFCYSSLFCIHFTEKFKLAEQ